MKKIISDLVKLADSLDRQGQYKLASTIDFIIKKHSKNNDSSLKVFENIGQRQVEIPEEEFENLKSVSDRLKESLSKKFED